MSSYEKKLYVCGVVPPTAQVGNVASDNDFGNSGVVLEGSVFRVKFGNERSPAE